MAFYIGSNKYKINVGSSLCYSNFYSTIVSMITGVALLSYDNYILKDKNGLYLTAKESE